MDDKRRPSLLNTLKSPLLDQESSLLSTTSSIGGVSSINYNNNNNNNNSNNNDNSSVVDNPFQLNTSIWQSSVSPLNDPGLNASTVSANSSRNEPIYRRASDFHPNYTTSWNKNNNSNMNSSFSEDWAQPPRKFSLDSYNSSSMNYTQQQPLQFKNSVQQQQQHHQQMSNYGYTSAGGSLGSGSTGGYDVGSPGPHQQNQVYPNESTAQMAQNYKSLDFYFNSDPHNRISINADSLNNTDIEHLLTQKKHDGGQVTLPKFPNNSQLPSQQLLLVSFKSGRIDCFYLPESSTLILKTGDLVIVEADRGKDLGKIVKMNVSIDEFRLLKYLQFMEQQAALNSFEATSSSIGSNHGQNSNQNVPALHFPKPVLRLALSQEVFQLLTKLQDEEKAKRICQFKIESSPLVAARDSMEPLSLPATPQGSLSASMSIIDAEYQFDRKKLIFYYKANHRIDFRDLVRDLFRIYKTRIWMCAVNSNQVITVPPEDQTLLAQMSKVDMRAWSTSPTFPPSSLYGNDGQQFQQQQQQQQYQYSQFQPDYQIPRNDFTGFKQDIWSSSSPAPPHSASNYGGHSLKYNMPSSAPAPPNSLIGMMNETGLYSQPQETIGASHSGGVAASSGSHGSAAGRSGSFSIWN